MQETILLTGFGPFGEHTHNPSQDAVQAMDGRSCEGFRFKALTLPVQLERATEALEEALAGAPVAAVIACGIYGDASGPVRLELAARNRLHYSVPDVDGKLCRNEVVEAGAPELLYGTLPLAGIKQRLEREGVACTLSEDAGSYLCNAVFYWLARRGLPEGTPVGFVHLPHGAEAQPDNLKALHAAAEETARRLAAQRVEATA